MAGRYAPGGDTFRTALVALVVALLVGVGLGVLADVGVTAAVVAGTVTGALSTVLVGPARDRRPARSNRSS